MKTTALESYNELELHCLICTLAPVHLVKGGRTEDSILFYHVIAIKAMC